MNLFKSIVNSTESFVSSTLLSPLDKIVFSPPSPPSYTSFSSPSVYPGTNIHFITNGSSAPSNAKSSLSGQVPIKTVVLETGDKDEALFCLLWVHGNASDLAEESKFFFTLAKMLNVYLVSVEYPGYGCAPGSPSEASVDKAVLDAYRYVSDGLKFPNDHIIFCGRSLGTGPVTRLAANIIEKQLLARKTSSPNPSDTDEFNKKITKASALGGLVLWSPIRSVQDLSKQVVGSVIGSVVGERWNNLEAIEKISCPVLFLIGANDSLTTPQSAMSLKVACGSEFIIDHTSQKADHNNGWDFSDDVVAPFSRLIALIQSIRSIGRTPRGSFSTESTDMIDYQPLTSKSPKTDVLDAKESSSLEIKALFEEHKPRVVIVGCGPCGLWIASSLAHQGLKDILCVDKHDSYKRHHVLKLEKASIGGEAPEGLTKSCEKLVGLTKTSLIEETLMKESLRLGVKIVRPFNVTDPEEFVNIAESSGCNFIVCCDGSHSRFRSTFFGGLETKETLQHVLDIRFEILCPDGKRPDKLSFPTIMTISRLLPLIGEESIGKTVSDGKCPATLRLLISPEEFKVCRDIGATLRTPVHLPQHKHDLPPAIYESITIWLNARRKYLNPNEKVQNVSATAIDLNCYRSKMFAVHRQSLRLFLAGDAAFGVPFFRALNAGLICSSMVAKVILKEMSGAYPAHEREHLYVASSHGDEEQELKSKKSGVVNSLVKGTEKIATTNSVFALTFASTSMSGQLSQIIAHASVDAVSETVIGSSDDPLKFYDDYARKISRNEFSVAKAKKEGLSIVVLANMLRRTFEAQETFVLRQTSKVTSIASSTFSSLSLSSSSKEASNLSKASMDGDDLTANDPLES